MGSGSKARSCTLPIERPLNPASPMVDLPLTTTKLLDCLRSPAATPSAIDNGELHDSGSAWKEIDDRYRPVLIGLTRSLGLSQADAEDAAQWTLAEFARGLREGDYQRGKGRLRSWVMGIARHRAQMIKRASARRVRSPQDGPGQVHAPLPDVPDEASLDALWEREVERAVFAQAWQLAQLRFTPATLRAFELVAMRGVPVEAAARECQMSVESVYVSKSRVTRGLKELATELTVRYDQDQ